MAYAAGTEVPVDKTVSEIKRELAKVGATHFMVGEAPTEAMVAFEAKGRRVRFTVPMPKIEAFRLHSRGARTASAQRKAWEAEIRRRWRSLGLLVKAKVEAVESGIVTFEQEFYANVMMPNGGTIYEETKDRVRAVYDGGMVGPLLPHYEGPPAIEGPK